MLDPANLPTSRSQDHFYICKTHLKDKGFANPIVDEKVEAEKRKKESLDRQIAEIKKEYEERQKQKKAKKKSKDDKDKKEDVEDDSKAEKERDDKVGLTSMQPFHLLTTSRSKLLRLVQIQVQQLMAGREYSRCKGWYRSIRYDGVVL